MSKDKDAATRGIQLDFLQDEGRVELIEILESVRNTVLLNAILFSISLNSILCLCLM